jgi:hypothetical protein
MKLKKRRGEERREVQKLGAMNEIYAGYKGETKNRRLT